MNRNRGMMILLAMMLAGSLIAVLTAGKPKSDSDVLAQKRETAVLTAMHSDVEESKASAPATLPESTNASAETVLQSIPEIDPVTGERRYMSPRDQDGDGIDDQTDILLSAKQYVATNPVYDNRYYENGYPDDGCGVCTDVVAFALLGAGYDIRDLIYEDILLAPDEYDCLNPDRNLEFRKVEVMDVYFRRHATILTLDLSDTSQWQGGDILVMDGHVGILSDRRNERGVPYLIHNGSVSQDGYEQDVVDTRQDIVAHYRIS